MRPAARCACGTSRARPLQLTSAPEIAALLPTAEGYVIVRRYWACPGETLVRVEGSQLRFSARASARFRGEMARLMDAGLYHAVARGFEYWWVAEPSGTIALASWAALQRCKDDDRSEQLEILDARLAQRTVSASPEA